jgi:hypothetical protein
VVDLTNQLPIAAVFIVSFSALLIGLLLYYRARREAHYNLEKHRVELEMFRASFENRIYNLTDQLMSTEGRWRDLNHLLISRLETQPDSVESHSTVPTTKFLKTHGLTGNELQVDPRLVFVLTPFNERFQESFDTIAAACRDVGLHCLRGDEEQVQGDLMSHILRSIVKARLIIANIDGRNPNVFYELGIAHALDKVTILVTKSIKSAPFDLRAKKLIIYQDMNELQEGLLKELTRSLLPNVKKEFEPKSERKLRIVIAGVPPGVKIGVFDERKENEDEARQIFLEEVTASDRVIEKEIDASYSGAPVKVVIRSVGFLPVEFYDTIDERIGLLHAAKLEIDRVYSGGDIDVPLGWNSEVEHRKAQKLIQDRLIELLA